jgi:YD repeat-containing protein
LQQNQFVSYVWSYNKQYPVAKVQNADYATVQGLLGGAAVLDNFSNSNPTDAQIRSFLAALRTGLNGALVTTYTYDPLVGMTSMTDEKGITTYYEYDGFQRLINIRDKDGNIIKHMDYHYQGQ